MKGFLIGLATQHLGTKFLALVLSMLVFVFVQDSITETRDIPSLALDFQLGPELEGKYVLITNTVVINGVKIQGTQGVVGQDAKDLRVPRRVQVTEAFHNQWANKEGGTIPITAQLIESQLEAGVSIVSLIRDGLFVRIERLESRDATITFDPDGNMKLPPAFYVQGTLPSGSIEPDVNVKNVRVTAPESLFASLEANEKPVIYYSLPDIQAHLLDMNITKEEETVSLTKTDGLIVDWNASGVASNLLPHLRWEAVELGDAPVATAEFVRRLQVSFNVIQKQHQEELEIPIVVRTNNDPDRDPLTWKAVGSPLTTNAFDSRRVKLRVQMPRSLSRPDVKEALVLVVDFSAAMEDADELLVPFYLDYVAGKQAERTDVARIRIIVEEQRAKFQRRR